MLFKVYKSWKSYDGEGTEFIEERKFESFKELFDYVERKEKELDGIGQIYRGEIYIEEN